MTMYRLTLETFSEDLLNLPLNEKKHLIKQDKFLDIFVNDENYMVRLSVAFRVYGFEKLVHDKNWMVRAVVARKGYGLKILVYDNCKTVRQLVARKGYGLDLLINDKDLDIRNEVLKYLERYEYNDIDEWTEENLDKWAECVHS